MIHGATVRHDREPSGYVTDGNYPDERASAAAFNDAIRRANALRDGGLWRMYHEVGGVLIQPRAAQEDKDVRIDRILVPTRWLVSQGWTHGAVGVEIKQSGVKVGKPIGQCMDYLRAAFKLPDEVGSVRVVLDWVFLWPLSPPSGSVASIMAQNRVGIAFSHRYMTLQLKSGSDNLLRIERDGRITVGEGANGRKAGSR